MTREQLIEKKKKIFGDKEFIIDAHCHIFNADYIPKVIKKRYLFDEKLVEAFLKTVDNPFDKDDICDRARKLISISQEDSIMKVVKALLGESPLMPKMVFTPLMMDMEYTIKSNPTPLPEFEQQIKGMSKVVLKYPGEFLPFIAADPRRIEKNKNNSRDPDGINYIIDALENKGFWGVKIYPPLGYLPSDPNLMPLYGYCAEHKIPITAHCSFGGKIYPKGGTMKKYYQKANPENWAPVLASDSLKDLKLNLAHFGGDIYARRLIFRDRYRENIEKKWRKTIVEYLQKYENVYADIANHIAIFVKPKEYFTRLKEYMKNSKIRSKILFGTDWWVARWVSSEWYYLGKFTNYAKEYDINESHIKDLLYNNSINFLGLNDFGKGRPLSNYIKFLERGLSSDEA